MDAKKLEEVVQQAIRSYNAASDSERQQLEPLTVEALWLLGYTSLIDEPLARGERSHSADPVQPGVTDARGGLQFRSAVEPLTIRQVPSLCRVALMEGKVNAKVLAALATRPVVSVHELEQEICLTEGIPTFAGTGLGPSLSKLPIVQHCFQSGNHKILPVSSVSFMNFIAFHADAEPLRHGIGDVRDAINSFRHYYDTEIWPSLRASLPPAEAQFYPLHVGNTRALGLHIRNFPELISSLRQEQQIHEMQASWNALSTASTLFSNEQKANLPLYRKVVIALDHHIQNEAEHPGDSGRSFSIHCTQEEMNGFALPSGFRKRFSANLPYGGYALTFHLDSGDTTLLGVEETPNNVKLVHGDNLEGCRDDVMAAAVKHVAHPPSDGDFVQRSVVPNTANNKSRAKRVKRGVIVSDDGDRGIQEMPPVVIEPASEIVSSTGDHFLSPLGHTDGLLSRRIFCNSNNIVASIASDTVNELEKTAETTLRADCAADFSASFNLPHVAKIQDVDTSCSDRMEVLSVDKKGPSEKQVVESPIQSLMQFLNGQKDEKTDVEFCISQLERLTEGTEVPLSLFPSIFSRLESLFKADSVCGTQEQRTRWRRRSFIPLFTALEGPLSEGRARITNIISPLEACWSGQEEKVRNNAESSLFQPFSFERQPALWNERSEVTFHEREKKKQAMMKKFLDFCTLSSCYPAHLRDVFIDHIGVNSLPCTATWFGIWRVMSRCGYAVFNEVEEYEWNQCYIGMLAYCVTQDFSFRLREALSNKRSKIVLRSVVMQVLEEMLCNIPEEASYRWHLFPFSHQQWKRGVDGLFCCGPRYMGCRQMYFEPYSGLQGVFGDRGSKDANKNHHRLYSLCFEEDIHFVVEAVLQRCGVQSVARVTIPFVSIEHPQSRGAYHDEAAAAASLHARIAAVVPCVQVFLRRWHPVMYALSYHEITQRLLHLRVVLGYQLRVTELLTNKLNGESFKMTQCPRLCYVSSHNTIYGAAELFATPALVEVICDLFLPISAEGTVRLELKRLLHEWLSAISDVQGEVIDLQEALHRMETERERLAAIPLPLTSASSGSLQLELDHIPLKHLLSVDHLVDQDLPWEIGPSPGRVQRSQFPPGTDVFQLARSLRFESTTIKPKSRNGMGTAGHDCPVKEKAGGQCITKPVVGGKGASAFGIAPPQWNNDEDLCFTHPSVILDQFMKSTESRTWPALLKTRSQDGASPCSVTSSSVTPSLAKENVESLAGDGVIRQVGQKCPRDASEEHSDASAMISFSMGQAHATARAREEQATRKYAMAAEKFIWELLRERYAQESDIRVIWLNEDQERGEPYDILVVRQNQAAMNDRVHGSSRHRIICFVEVKSTCTSNRHDFELSLNELLFAARYGTAYHVHRVYGASTNTLRTMKSSEYTDIISLWRKGQMTLTGDIRAIPCITSSAFKIH